MMNPEALMAEWMLAYSPIAPIAMGAMGAAGFFTLDTLYGCVQWKGNFEGSNPDKIVQIKDQVGIWFGSVWSCFHYLSVVCFVAHINMGA